MRSLVAAALAAFALALPVRAQSLVQIGLAGEIDAQGGAHVEIDVTFATATGEAVTSGVALHLAERTSAADVALLVVQRLRQVGASPVYEPNHTPARGPAMIFVPDCLGVASRLGHGLKASITLCEEAPARVRLVPGQDQRSAARVTCAASAFDAHTKERRRTVFAVELDTKHDAGDAATRLMRGAVDAGWKSELQGHDAWLPGTAVNGARIEGVSFELDSPGDWRIEVEAPRRRSDR